MTPLLEDALTLAMGSEIGPHFKLDDACRAGRIDTPENRKKCGYVNDPLDTGGLTKYGIAQNKNPGVDVENLTWQDALRIYETEYWDKCGAEFLPPAIALAHFDCAVNLGVSQAGKILQRAVGAEPDGAVGPKTLALALDKDPLNLLHSILAGRRAFYYKLVERKPAQGRFLQGWLNRVDKVEKTAKERL